MGSKRSMLRNCLGDILALQADSATRIVDLFSGSGAVSWYAATELQKSVLSNDLQQYACVLAESVVSRTNPIVVDRIERIWLDRVLRSRTRLDGWKEACMLDEGELPIESWCKEARSLCSRRGSTKYVVWKAYGGHYFSPTQALSFDAMLRTLPEERQLRIVCQAATIIAASCCVAAPGHTAQPFTYSGSGGRFLREAWLRDPLQYVHRALRRIAGLYARRIGETSQMDANVLATTLDGGDLVFVDPPYSSVQYSRFYHVLETLARGRCGTVQGVGRYPPRPERPTSLYSRATTATDRIRHLLQSLSQNGCRVVVTLPVGRCSNGLSGEEVERDAKRYFDVRRYVVESKFSTLGGNTRNRVARKKASEVILVLT